MKKEKSPRNLQEEIERNFDNCWDVHSGPDGGESHFYTNIAIEKSANMIKEIAKDYNEWFSKRLESWMDSQLDFPEMTDSKIDLFDFYLKKKYEQR